MNADGINEKYSADLIGDSWNSSLRMIRWPYASTSAGLCVLVLAQSGVAQEQKQPADQATIDNCIENGVK